MAVINVLDKHIAELIAAGEVVERPSSVIKELVENSIDAGATAVTVEIKNGGNTFMRVTDDGCGICREDVPKAFLRHATSKIGTQSDLDSIATLGFRGEALASVCAVARVEMLTRCADEDIGTHYVISGSDEQEISDAGCPKGCTIVVRDLFYNVPARMKFLKKDVSEGNSVAGVLDRMALSHPEIAFTFIRDGKRCLNTPGNGDLKACVYSVYGKEFANSLLNVNNTLNGIEVTGFISKPTAARSNRNMQHFFINGRYVKSRTAAAALEEACKGSVMVGKFPACVLYLTLPCETVDVNVHPAKIEVRFIDERPIFDSVYHSVKNAILNLDRPEHLKLSENPTKIQNDILNKITSNVKIKSAVSPSAYKNEVTPKTENKGLNIIDKSEVNFTPIVNEPQATKNTNKSYGIVRDSATELTTEDIKSAIQSNRSIESFLRERQASKNTTNDDEPEVTIPTRAVYVKPENTSALPTAAPYGSTSIKQAEIKEPDNTAYKTSKEIKADTERTESKPLIADAKPAVKVIGEIFETYILVQKEEDSITIIDKHAAHERIIYEKLKKEKGAGYAQYLLEPEAVALSKAEYDVILSNSELLSEAGFEIEDFGNGTVMIRSAPQYLDNYSVKATIEEIAGYLLDNKRSIHTEQIDWIYHSIACRAAIKAGHKTSPMELADLAKQLDDNPGLMYCPHGRPISIVMTKKELEKQFGRIQ